MSRKKTKTKKAAEAMRKQNQKDSPAAMRDGYAQTAQLDEESAPNTDDL